jgi:hypothetical protein
MEEGTNAVCQSCEACVASWVDAFFGGWATGRDVDADRDMALVD